MECLVKATNLSIGYRPSIPLAGGLNLRIYPGELIALMGPNGTGKSTLIRTLAGLQASLGGEIRIGDHELENLGLHERSRLMSIVFSEPPRPGLIRVYDLVAIGRHPHTNWSGRLDAHNRSVVAWAIESTGIHHLRGRLVHQLSDGERQKVMIARALAQDTALMFLDEPTAHLDLSNRAEIVGLLRRLSHDTGKSILMSTHDLELSLQAADRLWLLEKNGGIISGCPEDLVLDGSVGRLFESSEIAFDGERGTFSLQHNYRETVVLRGEGMPYFWTARALERNGFRVVRGGAFDLRVSVSATGENRFWILENRTDTLQYGSLAELIPAIKTRTSQNG